MMNKTWNELNYKELYRLGFPAEYVGFSYKKMYERFSGTKIGGRNNEVNRMRFHCTCFVYRFSIRLEVMTVKRIVILTFLIRAFCKYPFFFLFFLDENKRVYRTVDSLVTSYVLTLLATAV